MQAPRTTGLGGLEAPGRGEEVGGPQTPGRTGWEQWGQGLPELQAGSLGHGTGGPAGGLLCERAQVSPVPAEGALVPIEDLALAFPEIHTPHPPSRLPCLPASRKPQTLSFSLEIFLLKSPPGTRLPKVISLPGGCGASFTASRLHPGWERNPCPCKPVPSPPGTPAPRGVGPFALHPWLVRRDSGRVRLWSPE